MSTFVRLVLAGALIVAPVKTVDSASLPGYAVYVLLVVTILFHTSLFRSRLDRTKG